MSKVMLEEIVFDTWYGGRTVLLGDDESCGGLGAVLAIDDSVTVANWLSTLRMATEEDVEKVFKKYRAERYPVAKEAFQTSQMFIRNLGMVKRAGVRYRYCLPIASASYAHYQGESDPVHCEYFCGPLDVLVKECLDLHKAHSPQSKYETTCSATLNGVLKPPKRSHERSVLSKLQAEKTMNPTGGVGGVVAMHDSVTLANWLATLRFAGDKEILQVFKEYKSERYPVAKSAFESSQMFTKTLGKVRASIIFMLIGMYATFVTLD
ncbi:hypothetical protein BG000_002078 [Podila horticola]|nr:hypothetical protein BG000_002078 [Podila horticola]